jgi:hypothetical protein
VILLKKVVFLQVGFEPTTLRLTVSRSKPTELPENNVNYPGNPLRMRLPGLELTLLSWNFMFNYLTHDGSS